MSGSNPRNAEAVHDQGPLDATDLDADPIAQLRVWLPDAERPGVVLPNATALGRAGGAGARGGRRLAVGPSRAAPPRHPDGHHILHAGRAARRASSPRTPGRPAR